MNVSPIPHPWILLTCCLLLAACSTIPPELKAPDVQPVSLIQVVEHPKRYQGWVVRWGGRILQLTNEANDTWVQVLSYPLDGKGRPETDATPEGRFLIHTHAFLDPAIYLPDKELTVIGTLAGFEERMVGKRKIHIPRVEARGWYLWPKRQEPPPSPPPPYWWYDPWWGGCYRYPLCW